MKQQKTKEKPKAIYKVMSVAVSSGKMGMVLFMNKQLVTLKVSAKASRTTEQASQQMQKWIDKFNPDCIVTEQLDGDSRKHGRTPELIQAISKTITKHPILHIEVKREQTFNNKYEEAEILSERYLQLKPYLTKKHKIWQSEDRRMILFEAVANAEQII